MTSLGEPKIWDPIAFATGSRISKNFAVIVLNLPIQNADIFLRVLDRAHTVIAADGGANRIKHLYENIDRSFDRLRIPDAIVGDLDSLHPETESFFKHKGVPVYKDPDQYSTDFTKCLKFISARQKTNPAASDTIVFGGLGGRADQAFAQLHQLYTASQDENLHCGDLYLYSEESIIFLLYRGANSIRTAVGPDTLGENIGIIPIAKPAVITTKGLEWDVEQWETSFGTQVSTSNHIKSDKVLVETNERVLFTVELARKPSTTPNIENTKP